MKMTMKQALDAYMALNAISKAVLPGSIAKKLFDAREELDKHRKFYSEEEEKYIAQYGGETDGNGRIKFDTVEHNREYQKKIIEMLQIEIDVNVEHVGTISADTINVSMDGIEALKDIVTIE